MTLHQNQHHSMVYYDHEEQDAAGSVLAACERSVELLHQRWGLPIPKDVRVYVMTSWLKFLFQSAPGIWKGLLVLTLPLIARRARAIWPYVGGWSLQYGQRRVVGVKPHRLIQTAERGLGNQLFVPDRTIDEIVQSVTCHELVHAFTFHLRLPLWLHEGLATLSMEYFLDKRIVRNETLENLLLNPLPYHKTATQKLQTGDPQILLLQYAQGYWVTRYIEETRPGLLRECLSGSYVGEALEEKLVALYGKDRERFWKEIYYELSRWRPVGLSEP